MKRSILPYYYPTTIVLVDDNQRFLENFTLHLDENLAYICFSSAKQALSLINTQTTKVHLDQRCVSYYRDAQDSSDEDVLRLDLTLIEREISNPGRFKDISVVIVDYDMPEMTGLRFCQQIQDPRIKKVLLTGVADEKIAVQAFNEGLIDRFLMKSDPGITQKINQIIYDSQGKYFTEVSSLIQSTLALKSPDFLYDEAFVEYFFALKKQYSVVEYYYVEDPSGFLLVSDQGELRRLIVYSESEMQKMAFGLRRFDPPSDFLRAVSSGKAVPWLWEAPEDVSPSEDFVWDDYLHPAVRVQGRQPWLCAVVDNPPADIEYDRETSSFNAYLTTLDEANVFFDH